MTGYDKGTSHISSKLYMTYIYSNNVGQFQKLSGWKLLRTYILKEVDGILNNMKCHVFFLCLNGAT
jgi:hypothetical protein